MWGVDSNLRVKRVKEPPRLGKVVWGVDSNLRVKREKEPRLGKVVWGVDSNSIQVGRRIEGVEHSSSVVLVHQQRDVLLIVPVASY